MEPQTRFSGPASADGVSVRLNPTEFAAAGQYHLAEVAEARFEFAEQPARHSGFGPVLDRQPAFLAAGG